MKERATTLRTLHRRRGAKSIWGGLIGRAQAKGRPAAGAPGQTRTRGRNEQTSSLSRYLGYPDRCIRRLVYLYCPSRCRLELVVVELQAELRTSTGARCALRSSLNQHARGTAAARQDKHSPAQALTLLRPARPCRPLVAQKATPAIGRDTEPWQTSPSQMDHRSAGQKFPFGHVELLLSLTTWVINHCVRLFSGPLAQAIRMTRFVVHGHT